MILSEQQFDTIISSSSIPTYRGHAPIGQAVPYIVYNVNYGGNLGADNIAYKRIPSYTVTLYDTAPTSNRGSIADLLDANGLFWTADEVDEPEQELYMTIYQIGGLQ